MYPYMSSQQEKRNMDLLICGNMNGDNMGYLARKRILNKEKLNKLKKDVENIDKDVFATENKLSELKNERETKMAEIISLESEE